MTWLLEEDRLEKLMAESRLKDVGIMAGIATEKFLLMEGQPTQIMGQVEQKKLNDLLPAIMEEVKRRGANVQVIERKAEINIPVTV